MKMETSTENALNLIKANENITLQQLYDAFGAENDLEKKRVWGARFRALAKMGNQVIMDETQPLPGPSPTEIKEFLEFARISELRIKSEHELELVIWGLLCGKYSSIMKWRKSVGGRTCDISVGNIAIEMKYISTVSDKDRCAGQILDYLKSGCDVIVIAIDPNNYLLGMLADNPKVTIVRM